MSMHYDGECGYGLFLNSDEADAYADAFAEKNGLDIDDVFVDSGASYLSDDNYDMRSVYKLNSHPSDGDEFVDGAFFYADKQGSIVLNDEKNCYHSLSEMAEEFKKKMGDYLPADFDYLEHLCWFRGANYA